MDQLKQYTDWLGCKGTDQVTGFKGVVTSVCFDLYGCIMATLTPPVKEDGSSIDARWFDVGRIKIKKDKRVMPLPPFVPATDPQVADGKKGPAEKPAMPSGPQ